MVGKTKSTFTSAGIDEVTNPIKAVLVDKIVPYPIPLEFANSIVTNVSVLSFMLFKLFLFVTNLITLLSSFALTNGGNVTI